MFAAKGRLKVTLLVVGGLVVGLGMMAAFQVDEAEAHKLTWTEVFMAQSASKIHVQEIDTWTETTVVATYTWKVKCSVFKKDTITKKSTERRHTTYEQKSTDHYALDGRTYLCNYPQKLDSWLRCILDWQIVHHLCDNMGQKRRQ